MIVKTCLQQLYALECNRKQFSTLSTYLQGHYMHWKFETNKEIVTNFNTEFVHRWKNECNNEVTELDFCHFPIFKDKILNCPFHH